MATKLFITGATGLLGRQVLNRIVESSWEITALIRSKSKHKTLQISNHHKINWLEGDLLDVAVLEEGISGADFVIHIAAMVSFDPADRVKLFETNVTGTANVVNACLLNPNLKKLVHISSVASMSPSKPMPAEIDEKQGFNPDGRSSDYANSKYLAELEVARGVVEGLKAVMVNPSIILAPGSGDESSASLIEYARKSRPFYPTGWINFVDARDVALVAVRFLEEGPQDGERFILSANHTSYKEFLSEAAAALHARPPFIEAWRWMAEIAWRMDETVSFLIGKKPFLTRYTASASAKRLHYQSDKLRQLWPDFRYRSLTDTLTWIAATSD